MKEKIITPEEITLCENTELHNAARELATSTENNTKYSFILKYDINRKEELVVILEEMNGIIESENDESSEMTVSLNMEQLKLVKTLDLVERVRSDEGKNRFIKEEVDMSKNISAPNTFDDVQTSYSARTSTNDSCSNNTMKTAKEIDVETLVSGCICCVGAEHRNFRF